MSLPAGSPPQHSSSDGGGGGIGASLRQKSSGKKKGKGKKKRNSWQQSRDDRLKNSREEIDRRRKNKDLSHLSSHLSPHSWSPHNSSSDSESTASDSESSHEFGSPSSSSPVSLMGTAGVTDYRRLEGGVISMSMPLFLDKGASPSMVMADQGSSTVVAFDIRSSTGSGSESGSGGRTCYNCGQTGHLKRDCSTSVVVEGGGRGARMPYHEEGGDEIKNAKESQEMEQLCPVSLFQPRWIRSDQWQVRSASTSLDDFVVLGHSGEPGAAAITVWNRKNGEQLHTMYGPRGAVTSLTAMTERIMVSGDEGGAVCLWDVANGSMCCSLESTGASPVTSVSIANTFRSDIPYLILAGDAEGSLRVWEGVSSSSRGDGGGAGGGGGDGGGSSGSNKNNNKNNNNKNNNNSAADTPSKTTSVSSQVEESTMTFRLRDQHVLAHHGSVTTLAIAQWQVPVRLVVSGGEDWTIRMWETTVAQEDSTTEVKQGSTVHASDNEVNGGGRNGGWSKVLRGHTGPITGITLDLCKVTSCSMDGTIKIWGTVGKHAGNCLQTLSHPFSGARMIPIRCLSVGTLRIVAGFEDGTLLLYTFGWKDGGGGGGGGGGVKKKVKGKAKKMTNAWRKGGNSPQAKRHAKNTAKGSNRKYVSGGKRRSMRDLQARTTKHEDLFFFDFDEDF